MLDDDAGRQRSSSSRRRRRRRQKDKAFPSYPPNNSKYGSVVFFAILNGSFLK